MLKKGVYAMKNKVLLGLMVLGLMVLFACSNQAMLTESQSEMTTEVSNAAPGLLGARWSSTSTTFRIWSPDTANVKVWVNGTTYTCSPVYVAGYSDVYGRTVSGNLHKQEYYFLINDVKVRDPYGVMINNSNQNNVVLDLGQTDPVGGWAARPTMVQREDAVIYEVHVRDFTLDWTSGVTTSKRGKFLGMVEAGTEYSGYKTGIDHLKEMGVTHVQLLPFYDYQTPAYNWGYDPKNYNIPEEQYNINQDHVERIRELKTMVNEFHKAGIRVVMDVVYNHVYSTETFEKITEQYFNHEPIDQNTVSKRYDLSGCGNTIDSRKPMVSKMIEDSLNYWASEFKIDGFRFDLIGCLNYHEAAKWGVSVNSKNPGANILMYGEPWNGYATDPHEYDKVRMGKVPALSDGHVGVFNGNYREAIKGDNDGTGRGYIFNTAPGWIDAIKAGMRGSIMAVKSKDPLPNDWDSMFAYDPEQSINYISAHDNYCLWDKIIHCGVSGSYAKRIDKFGTGIILTSQGIPFIHAGDEMLRTKVYNGDWTYAHNSYNAPDQYNKIYWNWKRDNNDVYQYYKDMIHLRMAHPGFRLNTWDEINNWVDTTTHDSQLYTSIIESANNGDSWSRIMVIYNSGDNRVVSLPSGEWKVAVSGENASVGGTSVWNNFTAEGTAVSVLYQGGTTPTTTTTIGGDGVRTVIFMKMQTVTGQDIFVKGGHDAGLVPSPYPSMSEPITYLNTLNATTAAIKAADASLDWGSESALDWTTNSWPASWGTKKTYAVDGYGEDPENRWGAHYWKFDVVMDGANGEWYEFKAFMREGSTEWWESDRNQAGTPYSTINHWGKKGFITRCEYNQNWVEFIDI
jgi:pullulanase